VKFVALGYVKKILQTGEAFVTFEDPIHAQQACSVYGYKKYGISSNQQRY
jgi:hypothetical protein